MNRRARLTALGLGAVCFATAFAQNARFSTRLSTVPIDSSLQATVKGQGRVEAVLDGRMLTVDGEFEGLTGAASAAHLHLSPVTGVRGPAFAELSVESRPAGRVSGRVSLSRDESRAVEDGRVYVQIDSESAPEGNLWGWLLP